MTNVTESRRSLPSSSRGKPSPTGPARRGRRSTIVAALAIAGLSTTALVGSATGAGAAATQWSESFESGTAGVSKLGGSIGVHGRTSVTGAPGGKGGRALTMTAPGTNDGYTSKGVDKRATFSSLGLSPTNEAWLRYRVFFPDDFTWYAGGKLPGLSGISGGIKPFDYANNNMLDPRTWGGKIMWVADGKLKSYLYVPSAAGINITENRNGANNRLYGIMQPWTRGGKSGSGAMTLRKGSWNTIELHYKMNTLGRNDGVFEGYLNGELGVRMTDVRYRGSSHPTLDVNLLAFSSFFGGPTANKTDERWFFDDLSISPKRLG